MRKTLFAVLAATTILLTACGTPATTQSDATSIEPVASSEEAVAEATPEPTEEPLDPNEPVPKDKLPEGVYYQCGDIVITDVMHEAYVDLYERNLQEAIEILPGVEFADNATYIPSYANPEKANCFMKDEDGNTIWITRAEVDDEYTVEDGYTDANRPDGAIHPVTGNIWTVDLNGHGLWKKPEAHAAVVKQYYNNIFEKMERKYDTVVFTDSVFDETRTPKPGVQMYKDATWRIATKWPVEELTQDPVPGDGYTRETRPDGVINAQTGEIWNVGLSGAAYWGDAVDRAEMPFIDSLEVVSRADDIVSW